PREETAAERGKPPAGVRLHGPAFERPGGAAEAFALRLVAEAPPVAVCVPEGVAGRPAVPVAVLFPFRDGHPAEGRWLAHPLAPGRAGRHQGGDEGPAPRVQAFRPQEETAAQRDKPPA